MKLLIGILLNLYVFGASANVATVGKIIKRVGATQYMGTGFLIDQLSYELKESHSCQDQIYFVTANHVIKFANLGDTVDISFPLDTRNAFTPRFLEIKGQVLIRDIESDLSIVSFSKKTKQAIKQNLKCTGLKGSHVDIQHEVYLEGYPNFSLVPSHLSGNVFSTGRNQYLNYSFSDWLVIDQYTETGMSGGLVLNSNSNPVAMIFKKLVDSDPIQKPLTLSVEISKVASKIKSLIKSNVKKSYSYLMNTEEIEFQGIKFREVNRSKIEKYRQLEVLNIGAEGHDIGAEGHDIGAEGHDIGAEGHDIGGLVIDRYSFGIEIVSVSEYSPYSNLRKHLNGNNLLIVKSMNSQSIKGMVHLLKAIESIETNTTFDLMVNILNTSGTIEGRYFGHKDKEIIHEIVSHFDNVWEESRDRVTREIRTELSAIANRLKEVSLIIYANDGSNQDRLNILTREVIMLARRVKFSQKDLKSDWRNFRTSLFKLKGRNNGVRNEYL